ncbi:hypothetical protein [Agromyces allii]|uniref:Uncharacterized protein n=1 Tax=Agromyces allii TaxID=393607 RepID=A0ABP5BSM5_9MICO|nr:hypothetical protein [Agromyces allii]
MSSPRPALARVAIKFTAEDGRELVVEFEVSPSAPVRVIRGDLDLVNAGTREAMLVGVRRALAWDAAHRGPTAG